MQYLVLTMFRFLISFHFNHVGLNCKLFVTNSHFSVPESHEIHMTTQSHQQIFTYPLSESCFSSCSTSCCLREASHSIKGLASLRYFFPITPFSGTISTTLTVICLKTKATWLRKGIYSYLSVSQQNVSKFSEVYQISNIDSKLIRDGHPTPSSAQINVCW